MLSVIWGGFQSLILAAALLPLLLLIHGDDFFPKQNLIINAIKISILILRITKLKAALPRKEKRINTFDLASTFACGSNTDEFWLVFVYFCG